MEGEAAEEPPPLRPAPAASGGMDFAAIGAIIALILAIVVPLVLLMRTQKEGEQKEVRRLLA